MTISVIIPAYNEEKYITATLESVFKNSPKNLLEVIVVNNASTDHTAQVAASFMGTTVVQETQKGLTKARQKGLENAHGDLVAYIDADTHVTAQWFERINQEFQKDQNLICLSGPYYYYDLPAWQRLAVHMYYRSLAKITYSFTHYMVTGGNFVARREALNKIGFDSHIQFYGEDTDIARRLHALGKVKFLNSFVVDTSGRRMQAEGLARTGLRYVLNYGSIALLKKPLSKKYSDIR